MTIINHFAGDHAFLSNFYPSTLSMLYPQPESLFPMDLLPIDFPTVEHFFQAEKTEDLTKKQEIAAAATPGLAKKLGRSVELRADWESYKFRAMAQGVEAKFRGPLADALLGTGDAYLVEGNVWGDYTWGQVNGIGENWLGVILMAHRARLRHLAG